MKTNLLLFLPLLFLNPVLDSNDESFGTTLSTNYQSDYRVKYDCTVGVKKSDLEELNEYITANDQDGFLLAVRSKMNNKTAFRIVKGTSVRLLDSGFSYVKVRILDGVNKNKVGFIDREAIK